MKFYFNMCFFILMIRLTENISLYYGNLKKNVIFKLQYKIKCEYFVFYLLKICYNKYIKI